MQKKVALMIQFEAKYMKKESFTANVWLRGIDVINKTMMVNREQYAEIKQRLSNNSVFTLIVSTSILRWLLVGSIFDSFSSSKAEQNLQFAMFDLTFPRKWDQFNLEKELHEHFQINSIENSTPISP